MTTCRICSWDCSRWKSVARIIPGLYRSYTTHEKLTDGYLVLLENLRSLIGDGLCAGVYTQATDVKVEVNRLMTYDRAMIKMDVERPLRRISVCICHILLLRRLFQLRRDVNKAGDIQQASRVTAGSEQVSTIPTWQKV